MGKEYKFPALPEKCKGCGLELAGKPVDLGAMRGSQPMGYCPDCGYSYQIVEIESEAAEAAAEAEAEAEAETPPAPEPEPGVEPEPES